MKKRYDKACIPRAFCLSLVLFAALATGCTREDTTDCEWTPAKVRVKYTPLDANSAVSVDNIMLFVFDSSGTYLGEKSAAIDDITELNYPKAGPLKIITMANFRDDNAVLTSFGQGSSLGDGKLAVKLNGEKHEGTTDICETTPGDLLYCNESHVNQGNRKSEVKDLETELIVSRLRLTVNKLREFHNGNGSEFTVVVCTNNKSFNFDGTVSGDPIAYKPSCGFRAGEDILETKFNMLALNDEVTIKIYMDGQLVDTIDKDSDDNGLRAVKGRTLDVFVDYEGSLKVQVHLNGWQQETEWTKDFNRD